VNSARRVLTEFDALRQLAGGLTHGLEPSVSLCVDALFPLSALIALCTGFAEAFPSVELRIDTQVMSAVSARVLAGEATLGVVSPTGLARGLVRVPLVTIDMIAVVSPRHALGRVRGRVATQQLAQAVQIVLSERGESQVVDQAVLSHRTYRVADLHTKHELLRAGLGWGNLPEHLARDDLRARRLVRLRPESWGDHEHALSLSAIHRSDAVLGPAQRFLLAQLPTLCTHAVAPARTKPPATKRVRSAR